MEQKIYEKLKQAYSSLGLGDFILKAQSAALASLGVVSDDNIDEVIEGQRPFLEALQKSNDKRVTDAVASVKEKLMSGFDAEKAKLNEELAQLKKVKEEEVQNNKAEAKKTDDVFPSWYKTIQEQHDKEMEQLGGQIRELSATNQKLSEGLSNLTKENEAMKRASAVKARQDSIIAKAKELGIPQYRIDEGFVIAEDADDEAITSALSQVANNIKASQLHQQPSFGLGGDEPTKEEVQALGKMLVN